MENSPIIRLKGCKDRAPRISLLNSSIFTCIDPEEIKPMSRGGRQETHKRHQVLWPSQCTYCVGCEIFVKQRNTDFGTGYEATHLVNVFFPNSIRKEGQR